jgi:hypothetical protein
MKLVTINMPNREKMYSFDIRSILTDEKFIMNLQEQISFLHWEFTRNKKLTRFCSIVFLTIPTKYSSGGWILPVIRRARKYIIICTRFTFLENCNQLKNNHPITIMDPTEENKNNQADEEVK